jgi:hypothetical protein
MAHHTTEADMPWFELPGGFKFTFEAISPTTGAAITGVTVSDIAIYGNQLSLGILELDEVASELETLVLPARG